MDNTVLCKECGKQFPDSIGLHRHLKAHKMPMVVYYQKHYPRYDKFDGSIIRFKSLEYYLTSDFNSRANIACWFKKASVTEARNYLAEWFRVRKERKNLIWTPCQVELRTLPVPGLKYMQDLLDGAYYTWAEVLGFKNRFDLVDFSGPAEKYHGTDCILIDTREQMPLTFKGVRSRAEALPFGDYKLEDIVMSRNGYIERKAVGDLYSTLTTGYARFEKELNRAKDACAYMVIIVEGSFDEVIAYPTSYKTGGKVHIAPEFIFHNVRELIQKYDHIQFLFVQNREHASQAIQRIFASKGEYKRLDLQYAYDTGKLI